MSKRTQNRKVTYYFRLSDQLVKAIKKAFLAEQFERLKREIDLKAKTVIALRKINLHNAKDVFVKHSHHCVLPHLRYDLVHFLSVAHTHTHQEHPQKPPFIHFVPLFAMPFCTNKTNNNWYPYSGDWLPKCISRFANKRIGKYQELFVCFRDWLRWQKNLPKKKSSFFHALGDMLTLHPQGI